MKRDEKGQSLVGPGGAPFRLVSIGHGAIARSLGASLARTGVGSALQACLLSPLSTRRTIEGLHRFGDVDELVEARPELVVECAGHEAVRSVVPTILAAGIDVIVVSIGALADPVTLHAVERA